MLFPQASFGPKAPSLVLYLCLAVCAEAADVRDQVERLPAVDVTAVPGLPAEYPLKPVEHDDLPVVASSLEPAQPSDDWTWQVLPEGLMYTSYLAGVHEPRFAAQWTHERTAGWIWDIAFGGRVGIIRKGTTDPRYPEGWQIDMEGAAFPRLTLEGDTDLIACDYRFGLPVTHAVGPHHYKIGYYHISSHLGDEWLLRYPKMRRINYGRESMVVGYSYYWTPDLRLYAETAYAIGRGDFTEPWEFQFGVDYSPAEPTGLRPVPFMAINGHLRQEVDFGGNVVIQSGWQWRGRTGHLFRMGMHCYVGMSDQFEFYDRYESKVGFGIWYDY